MGTMSPEDRDRFAVALRHTLLAVEEVEPDEADFKLGIHIDNKQDVKSLVSSDGHRMHIAGADFLTAEAGSISTGDAFKIALSLEGVVEVQEKDEFRLSGLRGDLFKVEYRDLRPPDFKSAMQLDKQRVTFYFQSCEWSQRLRRIVNLGCQVGMGSVLILEIEDESSEVRIRFEHGKGKLWWSFPLLEESRAGMKTRICINGHYLADALENMDGDVEMCVRIGIADCPILFRCRELSAVVMPMREDKT